MRMRSLFGQFGRLFALSSLALALMIGATASLRAQSANDGEDVVREGVVEVFHIDYADHRSTRSEYFLRITGSNEVHKLRFENRVPRNLKPGAKVSVRGRAVGRQIWVQDVTAASGGGESAPSETTAPVEGAADDHSVLAMLLNIDDGGTVTWQWDNTDVTSVQNVLYGNTYSVDSLYSDA